MPQLNTDQEIDNALNSGKPLVVVGLNGDGDVQLQLPPGNDYIVLSPIQAIQLSTAILRHAERAIRAARTS